MNLDRRTFIRSTVVATGGLSLFKFPLDNALGNTGESLPKGTAPAPVALPHFPDRFHAFVWRNWSLVTTARLAEVAKATPGQILQTGQRMGLPKPSSISADQLRRSYLTVIRRNWHLLPYSQLLQLLGWSEEHMAFILREDDFLFIKLGSSKPNCDPVIFSEPNEKTLQRARDIAGTIQKAFPEGLPIESDPLFGFVAKLSEPLPPGQETLSSQKASSVQGAPRFCYSYFALYGDPLLEPESDPYPEAYLQRLAALGVNGVWLQGVLNKLVESPWDGPVEAAAKRLENLRALVARARKHGIGVYLYLNEPRARPIRFYGKHPELKGVTEGEYAALCTSHPEVQAYLTRSIAALCRAVPDLAGFFSITGSENLSNCWSHYQGAGCPRCKDRAPAEVIAELNGLFQKGIEQAGSKAQMLAWDWGWQDGWVEAIVQKLPASVSLMSVSEWSMPIRRGGVDSIVGEYSLSTIGPGPRAKRHWALARNRGLKAIAKIQAGNSWEMSAVPYIPALQNVARHAANLKAAGVDGLMLGWTLGGYPSPNLETACLIASSPKEFSTPQELNQVLLQVAQRRFGGLLAAAVVKAWGVCSEAFGEFPFHGELVYKAPMQFGPANLLWAKPTGYTSTMIGFPYDDLEGWRQSYPTDVFIRQFLTMGEGFEKAASQLRDAVDGVKGKISPGESTAVQQEIQLILTVAIHFRSTANQAGFISLRGQLAKAIDPKTVKELNDQSRPLLLSEIDLARRLYLLQQQDSRIGFEASNQYYYVPQDLLEKIVNCQSLLGVLGLES